jgi:class I fructose-bisphosphate aldolase
VNLLGNEAADLLEHRWVGIPPDMLHLPGPDFVDRILAQSDRRPGVLGSLQARFGHDRLGFGKTGVLAYGKLFGIRLIHQVR